MTESVNNSRRGLLKLAAAGIVSGAAGISSPNLYAVRSDEKYNPQTPEEAIQLLMEGNRRFIEEKFISFQEDLDVLREHTIAKQEPFAAILSCIDSRVPVELVFDQSIGHVLVARVAGNIATPEIIASVEYGAAVLHTKAILVLAHANCGAIKATIAGKAVPGQISALYQYMRLAVDQAGENAEAVAKQNARLQAKLLRESSPVLADLVREKKLLVVPAFYDVETGKVTLLES